MRLFAFAPLPLIAALAVTAPAQAQTAAEAQAFVDAAEKRLFDESIDAARIEWVNATYITDDTDALVAESSARCR